MAEKNESSCYKGWLWKWTNYVNGYQKRWFMLSNGLLSYYKSQGEVNIACRGTVILAGASIVTEDSCHFTISNGSAHRYHLKAGSEVERQRWITALELAKSLSSKLLDSEESSDGEAPSPQSARNAESWHVDLSHSSKSSLKDLSLNSGHSAQDERREIKATFIPLEAKLTDLDTCNNLIGKHGTSLLSALADLDAVERQQSSVLSASSVAKLKAINERAMLFRISSSAMISACAEFLQVAKSQSKKWQKILMHEREQRLRLEETLETLAKQHNSLERALNAGTGPPRSIGINNKTLSPIPTANNRPDARNSLASRNGSSIGSVASPYEPYCDNDDNDDDDEFLDACEEAYQEDQNRDENASQEKFSSLTSISEAMQSNRSAAKESSKLSLTAKQSGIVHRTRIPFKPNYKLNLWNIMKNCIGRDLSKIPMPVNFSEPLSMLQRLTEDLEYSEILENAAQCTNPYEQMAYVAAFSVSSYSTTLFRIGRPFNPMLGETYELDMSEEWGYRSVAEQVSHHPPSAAIHVESTRKDKHGGWTFWEQVTLSSKFRGKYISITPLGTCHLLFHRTGHHYTWNKVTITVHNIIVGKLWVDQSGDSNIVNHTTGDKCTITFSPYSYFTREIPRKVSGTVYDKDGNEHVSVFGTWDESMKCKKTGKNVPKTQQHTTLLWQKYPLPPLSEKMYYFTKMALILNEWVDGTAPTDSRRRPDQRKVEEGAWDDANKIKLELEDKQRFRRRLREAEEESKKERGQPIEPYRPRWFDRIACPLMNEESYAFNHKYWQAKQDQDWSRSVDIFDLSEPGPSSSSLPSTSAEQPASSSASP